MPFTIFCCVWWWIRILKFTQKQSTQTYNVISNGIIFDHNTNSYFINVNYKDYFKFKVPPIRPIRLFNAFCNSLNPVRPVLHDKAFAKLCSNSKLIDLSENSHLYNIQTVAVTEISASNLSTHIPPVKGSTGKFQPATVQSHPGNGRESIPAKPQVFEPVVTANINQFRNIIVPRLRP